MQELGEARYSYGAVAHVHGFLSAAPHKDDTGPVKNLWTCRIVRAAFIHSWAVTNARTTYCCITTS